MGLDRISHPQKLGDRLAEPDTRAISVVVLYEGWLKDLERLHTSLVEHLPDGEWELVVIDNPGDDEASERIATLANVTHVPLKQPIGWGAGRNLGLRLSRGRIVAIADCCVELIGDVVRPIAETLGDDRVGIVGRWGVVTADGFNFEEAPGPDVDGVEAYLMAMRRSILTEVGLFDPKFKWYRNADLDFSFRVRAAGYRTVVDQDIPVVRHVHRLWESAPGSEREELSKKNFRRFRAHWGDRQDLFLSP